MDRGPITTTTALLDALRSDEDSELWRNLVDRYAPLLQGVARRLGLGEADAADAAQQTLLEFVRDLRGGKFDRSRGRMRGWIATIAEHRCRDIQRRDRARRGLEPLTSLQPDELEAMWNDVEATHIAALAWEELRRSDGGASRSVEAFELVALRGVPSEEAARQLGMTVEAIYSARYRIASRLREEIDRLTVFYREDVA